MNTIRKIDPTIIKDVPKDLYFQDDRGNYLVDLDIIPVLVGRGLIIDNDLLAELEKQPVFTVLSYAEREDTQYAMGNPHFDHNTGILFFYDHTLDAHVSLTEYESDFGVDVSVNPGSWIARGGKAMDNKSAMARPYAIVVTEILVSSEKADPGTFFDALHFDMMGNNQQICGRLSIDKQNHKMGYASGLKIIIPEYRRLTMKTGGGVIVKPQGSFKYRQVIELNVINKEN